MLCYLLTIGRGENLVWTLLEIKLWIILLLLSEGVIFFYVEKTADQAFYYISSC